MLSYFYAIFVQFSDKLITLISFIVKVHQTKGADTEMKDISDMLANMMGEKDCSSVSALFALSEENKDVSVFQSESRRSLRGGVCAESNINVDETELGGHIH